MQLPCHIQREFQVHERLFDMMDGARGHLDLEAVVVEIIYDRPAKHADAQANSSYAPSRAVSRVGVMLHDGVRMLVPIGVFLVGVRIVFA